MFDFLVFFRQKMQTFRGCEKLIKNQNDAHGRELHDGVNKSEKRSIFEGLKLKILF